MQSVLAELDARVRAVRTRMAENDFSGLVVADPANIHYLTGYDAWSFYMPQFLFVPAEGDPLLITREMDAVGAHRTALTPRQNILGYPESYIHQPDRHPFDWAAAELRERGHAKPGRVGYESEAHFFSVRSFFALQQALPEWDLVPSHELVNWVRLVKSEYELDLLRKAGRVVSNAMRVGIEHVRAGARQNEVAAAIAHAQAVGVPGADGDYPAIVPMLPTGESADTPHMTWSNRELQLGEAVSIEIAGAHHRYHAPLARTVSIGKPNAQLDTLANVTAEGLEKVLATIRAGITVADVHAVWSDHLASAGLEKASRLGYSIGIGYPPDWGEHTVSIRGDDQTLLEPGMCFHVIAGMWMSGYGCELSESVAVTASGVEIFTDAPRHLISTEDS